MTLVVCTAINRLRPVALTAALLAAALLAGCASYGADAMRASRLAYNEAVQHSEQRELLLNLIRLRYLDAPEFLAINGISTQMTVEGGAILGGTFGEDGPSDLSLITPGASVGYSETPTITFTPQRDREFTRQLVAPVEIDSVYVLTQYGWGVDRVLRLVSGGVNGVSNDLARELGDTRSLQAVGEFSALVAVLGAEEKAGRLKVDLDQRRRVLSPLLPVDQLDAAQLLNATEGNRSFEYQSEPAGYLLVERESHYMLEVADSIWEVPAFTAAAERFGLPTGVSSYEIDPGRGAIDNPDNQLRIETRSVLAMMAYLSAAVEVPEAHRAQVVPSPSPQLEEIFDGLLEIRSARKNNVQAQLQVPYRGYWFYVADDDIESKKTLALLSSLIRLSINAGGAQNVPVLTLPVGR